MSPKAVPQMAGTDALLAALNPPADAELSVLVPNMKGYELARAAGAGTLAVVVSATETMNQKNIRMSLEQTLEVARAIIERARAEGAKIQAYLSVAWECPFEGAVPAETVIEQAGMLAGWGADEIVVADTIGAANPAGVRAVMDTLVQQHGTERLACHFHDTFGLGMANILAAKRLGVVSFETSFGGLGGCLLASGLGPLEEVLGDLGHACKLLSTYRGPLMPPSLRIRQKWTISPIIISSGRMMQWAT